MQTYIIFQAFSNKIRKNRSKWKTWVISQHILMQTNAKQQLIHNSELNELCTYFHLICVVKAVIHKPCNQRCLSHYNMQSCKCGTCACFVSSIFVFLTSLIFQHYSSIARNPNSERWDFSLRKYYIQNMHIKYNRTVWS